MSQFRFPLMTSNPSFDFLPFRVAWSSFVMELWWREWRKMSTPLCEMTISSCRLFTLTFDLTWSQNPFLSLVLRSSSILIQTHENSGNFSTCWCSGFKFAMFSLTVTGSAKRESCPAGANAWRSHLDGRWVYWSKGQYSFGVCRY